MNKMDLIASLHTVLSTKKEAKDTVEKIFDGIKNTLQSGEKVVISGFGSFHPYTARAKQGRNPKTGEKVHISPRKKIRFKLAKEFF